MHLSASGTIKQNDTVVTLLAFAPHLKNLADVQLCSEPK